MESFAPTLALLAGLAVGIGVGWLIARSRRPANVSDQLDLREARTTIVQLNERLADAQKATQDLKDQFAQERAQTQQAANEKGSIMEKIAPVDRTISDLKRKVEEMESARTKQHAEIQESIRNSTSLTDALSKSTQSLTTMLAGGAQRGRWGEVQLERVAELAGLRKDVDYTLQHTVAGEENRQRPDMVVNLPGGTQIAVDSKVPFDSYEKAMSVQDTDPDAAEKRKKFMTEHANALKAHIKTLASKDYAKSLTGKVDFVVCFVPAESVLSAAIESDPTLTEYAISQKVILASPLSLVAVLRPVAITWAQVENVERATEIVNLGKELYERLINLANKAVGLGSAIKKSVKEYNEFVGSLESRTLSSARKFHRLSANELPVVGEIEDATVREFGAAELLGLNAALDSGQQALGEPVDAEVLDDHGSLESLPIEDGDEPTSKKRGSKA